MADASTYIQAAIQAAETAANPAAEGAETPETQPETPVETSAGTPPVDPDEAAALAQDAAEPPAPFAAPKLEKNFDALIAKERKLRAEQESMKQQAEQYRRFEAMKGALDAKDPIALLSAAGMSWQDAVDRVVKGEAGKQEEEVSPAMKTLLDKVSSLEQTIRQEKMQAQAEASRQAVVSKAQALVEQSGDRYSLVKERNSIPEALAVLEAHYEATGELPGPTIEASLEMALDHVEQKHTAEMERWLTTSKAKSKLGGVQAKPVPKDASPVQVTSGQTKTLTSSHTPAPGGSGSRPAPKSDEDYRRAALEVFQNLK
jgi:hypothetical protein